MDEAMVGPAPRVWSLRREWNRAFFIMMVLAIIAGLATFVGVRHLVGDFKAPADRLDRETGIVLSLQAAIANHNNVAHGYVDGTMLRRDAATSAAYLEAQSEITAEFDGVLRMFPSAGAGRDPLTEARTVWQSNLTRAGLWGPQLATFVAPAAGTARYGQLQGQLSAGDITVAVDLGEVQQASFVALRAGLARATRLERLGALALIAVSGLVFAITVYFRRRLVRDLFRPVTDIHNGVIRLRAGDFGHAIAVARADEIGEVAGAFNEMAAALNDSHMDLTFRATHDPLTGTANRATLTERLAASFAVRDDGVSRQESVLFIDVDDFKDVNDTLGHEGGDTLLIQLTKRLKGCVRADDLVARLGGDEFAIVVVEGGGVTGADIAQRVLDALAVPFSVNGAELVVSVSIGVAGREADTADAADLLRHADFAMYMAKGGGKGRYQLFETAMRDTMIGRANFQADLAQVTTSGQLFLEYQPIADLRTGRVLGLEALVRWQHPTLGLLAPADFVPAAEQTGEILAIGAWVLDTAMRQVAEWRRTIPQCADLWVSVNVSAFELPDGHGRAAIEDVLLTAAADAGHVVLEVTESALAVRPRIGTEALNGLKGYGARIAIDDFGTGFASVTTLATLSVDVVKIDCAQLSAAADASPERPAPGTAAPAPVPLMARRRGIVGLADRLALDVIAKGIERQDQLDLVCALGCTAGQGFLLARPAHARAIEALLRSGGFVPLALRPAAV